MALPLCENDQTTNDLARLKLASPIANLIVRDAPVASVGIKSNCFIFNPESHYVDRFFKKRDFFSNKANEKNKHIQLKTHIHTLMIDQTQVITVVVCE
jgi:hypothetical protein